MSNRCSEEERKAFDIHEYAIVLLDRLEEAKITADVRFAIDFRLISIVFRLFSD